MGGADLVVLQSPKPRLKREDLRFLWLGRDQRRVKEGKGRARGMWEVGVDLFLDRRGERQRQRGLGLQRVVVSVALVAEGSFAVVAIIKEGRQKGRQGGWSSRSKITTHLLLLFSLAMSKAVIPN
jgi:hypothetical protein